MSSIEPLSDPHSINTITDRIKVLKLSLSLSHRLHEGYLMQLARIRITHAPAPAPAGDGGGVAIDPVYERVVLRNLVELDVIIAGKTQLVQELETNLRLLCLEADRGADWSL